MWVNGGVGAGGGQPPREPETPVGGLEFESPGVVCWMGFRSSGSLPVFPVGTPRTVDGSKSVR